MSEYKITHEFALLPCSVSKTRRVPRHWCTRYTVGFDVEVAGSSRVFPSSSPSEPAIGSQA